MSEESRQESGVMGWAASIVSAVASKNYLGGELEAAFLQGTRELGVALKAFPDSIQVDEPGTAFNPLYRDRDGDTPAHSYGGVEPMAMASPSEIANGGQAPGSVYGDTQPTAPQALPSPSDIADNPSSHKPPDQGNVHGRDEGMDMGRGR
jgi:hypothetical protein